MIRTKLTIEKLDGSIEVLFSDPYDPDGLLGKNFYMSSCGYHLKYENGREMIIHPNSVFRLIAEEINA